MKKLFYFFLSIYNLSLVAQEHPLATTLSYPLPIGDNFLGNYTGIVDVGANYRFLNGRAVVFGLGVNANFFTDTNTLGGVEFKSNFWMVQPKVLAELHLASLDKIVPFFGAGYALAGVKTTSSSSQVAVNKDSFGGLNINLGASYDFSERWFAQFQYDYVRLFRDVLGDKSFANNLAIIKLGMGYRF